jgi:hypothetical protein
VTRPRYHATSLTRTGEEIGRNGDDLAARLWQPGPAQRTATTTAGEAGLVPPAFDAVSSR